VFFHNTSYYLNLHYGEFISQFVTENNTVTVISPVDETTQVFADKGINHVPVPITRRGQNPFSELTIIFELIKIFRSLRPDILFNYSIKPNIYGSLAARYCGVPNIYSTVTGRGYVFGNQTYKQRLLRYIILAAYKRAFPANKCVFFQNREDRDYFISQHLVSVENTFVTAGTGIDLMAYQPVGKTELDAPNFLMISRLLRDKGIAEYVMAARQVKKHYPKTRFLLAGPLDDNPMSITRTELDAWVKEGIIEYLGVLGDVRIALAQATAFVLPSYYREGLPRVNLEAMAMGIPIITTDWPGCRETVIDRETGYLVPIKDIDALAKTMLNFVNDPNLSLVMGKASREYAQKVYDVAKVNQTILNEIHTRSTELKLP